MKMMNCGHFEWTSVKGVMSLEGADAYTEEGVDLNER